MLIRDYKNQLHDQQKQMLYMHEQLKVVKMEKDNNEKNYNRIFTHQPRIRVSVVVFSRRVYRIGRIETLRNGCRIRLMI